MRSLRRKKLMKFSFITVDQPVGRFYIAKINAEILIPISQSDTRTPYNSTGIQRKLNMERVKDIAKYCELTTAMFPTPIILSANSKYFKFYSDKNEPQEYKNLEAGYFDIDLDTIVQDQEFFSIVDGQHRLAGIDKSRMAREFDLLVMFVFDTQAYQDAEIFSTINLNQKQVSKSLVYDLYGLTDEMTVEKFSHEIIKVLNTVKVSSLKGRIKMLGYKTDNFKDSGELVKQYVSQAALVDELLPLISQDINEDNGCVKKGQAVKNPNDQKLILRKYFYEDDLYSVVVILIGFYNAWLDIIRKYFEESTIMFKTIGFIASFYIFKELYKRLENDKLFVNEKYDVSEIMNNEDLYIDINLINSYKMSFLRMMEEFNFTDIDINSISSSKSGAKSIVNNLTKDISENKR